MPFAARASTTSRRVLPTAAKSISTVHSQPYWAAKNGALDLPGASAWYDRCLSLPLYPAMADGDVARVVEALAEVLT